MDSTFDVAQKLMTLCRAGKNLEAVETLYAPDIESIEVHGTEAFPARVKGIEPVRKKNRWWLDNHEIHSAEAMGPWPHGDRFIVHFKYDVTAKAGPMAGRRMQMEEAGLYTVRDGKVVREEFFFHMG